VVGNTGAAAVAEGEWLALEDRLVPLASQASLGFADSRKLGPNGPPRTATFAREPLQLHVRFHNPLAIPLQMKNVSLACTFARAEERPPPAPATVEALLAALATPAQARPSLAPASSLAAGATRAAR